MEDPSEDVRKSEDELWHTDRGYEKKVNINRDRQTDIFLVTGDYRWLWVVSGGFGCLHRNQVVTGGYGWLRVVTRRYGWLQETPKWGQTSQTDKRHKETNSKLALYHIAFCLFAVPVMQRLPFQVCFGPNNRIRRLQSSLRLHSKPARDPPSDSKVWVWAGRTDGLLG